MEAGRWGWVAGYRLGVDRSILRFVLGLFFRHRLFSTTSVALFLALFFPQERVFNNFSALFLALFRFVFQADPLFSITSPVRFLK
ncbi:MAG: hypothetical protein WB819_03305 [Terriglobia bacterium]|jgi:hypothetical protein